VKTFFSKEGVFFMDKNLLLQRVQSMIQSSTKSPKYMTISTVKVADIFGVNPEEVQQGLEELVEEGYLQQSKLDSPPYHDIFLLP
jgi:predicted transcriptional regulator of viral defense system